MNSCYVHKYLGSSIAMRSHVQQNLMKTTSQGLRKMHALPKSKKLVEKKSAASARKPVATTKKAAIYSRTSSSANQHGDSHKRQIRAGLCALQSLGMQKKGLSLKRVSECISGMLPLQQRKKLMDLVSGTYSHVFVESLRSLARKPGAIEELHQVAKKSGTSIIVGDAGPDVFNPNATPAQNFQRRVLAAVTEFERDVIVHRLASGLQQKRTQLQATTGKINVKVNGRKSYLEHALQNCGTDEKKKKVIKKKLVTLCKLQQHGKVTWRQLAVKASKCLKLKKPMGKDAAITLSQKLGIFKQ